jgi:hypothetical protein
MGEGRKIVGPAEAHYCFLPSRFSHNLLSFLAGYGRKKGRLCSVRKAMEEGGKITEGESFLSFVLPFVLSSFLPSSSFHKSAFLPYVLFRKGEERRRE